MPETAITFDAPLFNRINQRASELNIKPRLLLAMAAEEYLDKHNHRKPAGGEESYDSLLARINKAHADGLDGEERALLSGMRRKYRKTLREPW